MTDKTPDPKSYKPRVVPLDGGFKYSASQIATKRDCFTKWFLDQTLGLPRQDTQSTLLGKKVHGELEAWLRDKTPPTNPRAKALLPLLPLPSPDLGVEFAFRLLTPPGVVRGFIDVNVSDPTKVVMPASWGEVSEGVPVVFDHKTTANLFYAKSDKDLVTDPQAILYGLAARVEARDKTGQTPENVDLNWNYVQTRGDPETKSVRLRQSLAIMEDGLGPIIEEAAVMRASLVKEADAADLPHDLSSCEKYGGCQFLEICPHSNRKAIPMSDIPNQELPSSSTLQRLQRLKAERKAAAAAAPPSPPNVPPNPPGVEAAPPAPPDITPEPTLEPIPSDRVEAATIPVEIVPPDAPPAKRGRKAVAAAQAAVIDVPVVENQDTSPTEEKLVEAIRTAATELIFIRVRQGRFYEAGNISGQVGALISSARSKPNDD